MKPVFPNPNLIELAHRLDEYEQILANHTHAKIVSLRERRKILSERAELLKEFVKQSKKALYG